MEKQNNYLRKVFTGITFSSVLLIMVSCKEEKNSVHDDHVSQAKINPVEIDINSSAILNRKDPLGGSSPLISACLFGIAESFYYIPGTNNNFK